LQAGGRFATKASRLEINHKPLETFPGWQILHGDKGNKLSDAPSNGQWDESTQGREKMSTLLMIILVLLLVGALPTWPYSTGWGYYPAGGLGLVLLITLVFLLFSGRTV
jgi:hypothetical protein